MVPIDRYIQCNFDRTNNQRRSHTTALKTGLVLYTTVNIKVTELQYDSDLSRNVPTSHDVSFNVACIWDRTFSPKTFSRLFIYLVIITIIFIFAAKFTEVVL